MNKNIYEAVKIHEEQIVKPEYLESAFKRDFNPR